MAGGGHVIFVLLKFILYYRQKKNTRNHRNRERKNEMAWWNIDGTQQNVYTTDRSAMIRGIYTPVFQ